MPKCKHMEWDVWSGLVHVVSSGFRCHDSFLLIIPRFTNYQPLIMFPIERLISETPVSFTRLVDRPPGDEVGDMDSGLGKFHQIFVATRLSIRIILLHSEL